ncbi:DUF642 domain-containing protein [Streptomyces rubiginosohelvolus]|uniref:DUF642 domain-containing protein n=1 Tax=Streptomyces rubiginosohelvolus TaxID=67362 RepID=UPI0035E2AB8A
MSAAALLLGTTAATASAAPSPATPTTRVWSDGFEQPVVLAPQPFTGIAGQTFGPWTVTSGSVDLVSDRFWDAAEGDQSVDLSGGAPGSISQTVPALPLTTYVVTYKLAGNTGAAPVVKTGEVRVNGVLIDDLTFDTTGRGPRDMGWEQRIAYFTTVLDTSATLTFTSTTTGFHGPAVDDVTIRSCLLVLCLHKGTQLGPHSR